MKNVVSLFLDIVFPPHADVLEARAVERETLFRHFSLRFTTELRIYTALPYSDRKVRALIRANKYHADTHSAKLLAEVLTEALMGVLEERALENAWQKPLLIPIPASSARVRERGFNQVARILDRLPPGPWERRDLLKRYHRVSQTKVQRSERAKNIKNAFYVPVRHRAAIADRTIIVVDDVCESGSTMRDAKRALRECGAREIVGVALAR